MGMKANETRRKTQRSIRPALLTDEEKDFLRQNAGYEGRNYHKFSPALFNLPPNSSPTGDKSKCDDDLLPNPVRAPADAGRLLARAIDVGLVSDGEAEAGFPKQLWVVEDGQVFEAMYGGIRRGLYHGYPIQRTDPFFDRIKRAWPV